MVLDDNLAGQSVMCGCFKSFKRQIVWVTSSQFSRSPAKFFSRILYRWRISVHFEFLPQKSLIRYTERDRMEFNTSSCLAVLSSWNLESLNSIWSSPWWYFPSHSWFYFQIRWFYIVSTCNFKCVITILTEFSCSIQVYQASTELGLNGKVRIPLGSF